MTEPDHDVLRSELERTILGSAPELTAEQVAQASGVTVAQARRLWRALGFPDAVDAVAFTEPDVRALTAIETVRGMGLDEDTIVAMARAVGSTMSRLADWEVDNLTAVLSAERTSEASSLEDRFAASTQLVSQMAPIFDEVLLYAWRRHLAVAVARAELLQPEEETPMATVTVGFADLVNFTAVTNELDEDRIGELVAVFESRSHDVIAEHGGRIIKSLGDSVLFVSASPAGGIDIGLDIIGVIGGDKRLPDVRVGVATGPAVLRMGDVFGPSVNLAARLTTVARRNRVIIDQATAAEVSGQDFEVRSLPARPLRGFGDVVPATARRTRPRHAG
ncbi:adenylate/guanylate cyclase domain-containing protein [Nocardioides terrisoli]|uniref:adenylate/guanylate cyclase domain-containing protein n=1 Tax=Nocardioides terrisoli TaxID=3388267 RepID=UPI00287B6B8C|nr:adenylate/guanylate cyclase domain-containing protein [Nocardioides marmorisolisilvae]